MNLSAADINSWVINMSARNIVPQGNGSYGLPGENGGRLSVCNSVNVALNIGVMYHGNASLEAFRISPTSEPQVLQVFCFAVLFEDSLEGLPLDFPHVLGQLFELLDDGVLLKNSHLRRWTS